MAKIRIIKVEAKKRFFISSHILSFVNPWLFELTSSIFFKIIWYDKYRSRKLKFVRYKVYSCSVFGSKNILLPQQNCCWSYVAIIGIIFWILIRFFFRKTNTILLSFEFVVAIDFFLEIRQPVLENCNLVPKSR